MLERVKDILFLTLFSGFALSGIAAMPIGLWLATETGSDPRSFRERAIAALQGEWPDLPAAVWYRRAWAGVLGCWSAALVLLIALFVLDQLF